MNLVEIKKLARNGSIASALNKINLVLEKEGGQLEALRVRAYIYNLDENYDKSLADRLAVLKVKEPKLKDYYLAANSALFTKSHSLVKELLNELLARGMAENNAWFNSTAYFLLAYCHMQEGNYQKAHIFLDSFELIEKDISVPVPLVAKMYTVKALRSEILSKEAALK